MADFRIRPARALDIARSPEEMRRVLGLGSAATGDSTDFAGRVGDLHGGAILAPIRVPHLVVDDAYPQRGYSHIVLWADPTGLMYASAADKSFLKSTDHGKTWTHRGTTGAQLWHPQAFLRLASGTLLAVDQAYAIIRSTDDGATWTTTHNSRTNTNPMGPSSWCEDQNGHIYVGEYQVVDTFTEIRVYRSTDDGATFTVFHTFPGPATTDPARVRHVHGVQYDPVSQRVFVMTGDSETAAGIYRTNASTGATTLERVATNADLATLAATQARAIGMMFFPEHLAWGVDGTEAPNLVRMARDQIGAASPTAEIVYRLSSTSWFTTRASADGTVWLLSASKEGATALDKAIHLYAVEEGGSRVYEVGTYPQGSTAATGALAPIGKPEVHTDRAWLQTYNLFDESGVKRYTSMAVRLARGVQPLPLAPPPAPPAVLAWQTISSGLLTMSTPSTVVIGQTRSGSVRRRLLIHDWTVRRTTGTGTAKIQLYNLSTATVVWESTVTGTIGSQRSTASRDDTPWIDEVTFAVSQAVEVRVVTTTDFTGNAQLVYGWAYA